MKTATANFKTKANLSQGTTPVILAKIFYGTSSSFLCSTKKVVIGTDTYKPYVISFNSINYTVPEIPGLGSRSSCDIILARKIFAETGGGTENVAENLLTQKSKGKKVQLWQFFEGLADTDKLPIANFIIDEVSEISPSEIKLRCISPEYLLNIEIPKLKFNKTDFVNLLEDNLGLIRPIIFGKPRYSFTESPISGGDAFEYLWCSRPHNPPIPAFLTDIYDFKFVVHDGPTAIKLSAGQTEEEFFEWFSEWGLYAFCRATDDNDQIWTISASGGRDTIDMDALYNVSPTGRDRYIRVMPAENHFDNGATDWKKAIDLDHTSTCAIPASTNLMVVFDEKNALSETTIIQRLICFNVIAVSGTIEVLDGTIGGSETSRGTFSTTGYKEVGSAVGSDTSIAQGYYMKIAVGAGESCTINGLHLKIRFRSNKRPFSTFIPPGMLRVRTFRRNREFFISSPGAPPVWENPASMNNYFFNGHGVDVDTDTKGYNYEHPLYIAQYILRQILGYASSDLAYANSWVGTNTYLTNNQGPAGEFTHWKFAASLTNARAAGDWLSELMQNCLCWLYWGAEGWNIFPIDYASQITGILTFKDTDSVRPMENFKLYRSRYIYNNFLFDWDFEHASGKFREEIIYDQVNKTELTTSVTDYGESVYPFRDYYFIHRPGFPISSSTNATPIVVTVPHHLFPNGDKIQISNHLTNTNAIGIWEIANVTTNTFELVGSSGNGVGGATGEAINLTLGKSSQVDNLYSVLKRSFKDPRWIIEFETRLSASWLEVGDNFRINHPAASGITGNGGATLNDNTDFQIIEHRQTGNRIYLKAVEIVP